MPQWNEYKAEAKARGAMAHELFAVVSMPAAQPEKIAETLPAHLAYQAELEASGHLFLAGPMSDESGDLIEGIGLIIYRAASFEEAEAMAANDPMHLTGARTSTLRRWLVNEGAISLDLRLSARKIVLK